MNPSDISIWISKYAIYLAVAIVLGYMMYVVYSLIMQFKAKLKKQYEKKKKDKA